MAKKKQDVPAGEAPSEAAASDERPATGSDVDRIRQIIFGAQMEDYETRFGVLERRLQEAVEMLRAEMSQGLSDLQQEVAGKSSDLGNRLADSTELVNRIGRLQSTLEERIEAVVAKFEEASAALASDLQSQHAELLKTLDARVKELRAVKADRATLATLLTDLAGNLTADSEPRVVK